MRRASPEAAAVEEAVERARALQRSGALAEAAAGYRAALALDANNVDAHMNLGISLAAMGVRHDAVQHCRRALELLPNHPRLHHDFAIALAELGQWEDAIAEARRATALDPRGSEALANLGSILIEVGRREEAAAALRYATTLNAMFAPPHFDLARAVFDDGDLGPAIDALTKAVVTDLSFVGARFNLGVALDLAGNPKAARQHFESLHEDRSVFRAAVESWEYAKAHRGPSTRFLVTTRDMLLFGVDAATQAGLVLDLGARHGVSTGWIAERAPGKVHALGGAPEPEGDATEGGLPLTPSNVEVHAGPLEATLRALLQGDGGPIRFASVGASGHDATAATLEALAGHLVPGTVLVFDEYLLNDAWREAGFKAFEEMSTRRGVRHEYLAFSLFTGQAVVRIL